MVLQGVLHERDESGHANQSQRKEDAFGFVQSFYRIFKRGLFRDSMPLSDYLVLPHQISNYDLTPLTAYLDERTTVVSLPQFLTLWWLAIVEWYLAQCEKGIPVLTVRFHTMQLFRSGHDERS